MKKEYFIIQDTDEFKFGKEVSRMLDEGWELHGNLIAVSRQYENGPGEEINYIQAVVKKTGDPWAASM